MFKGGVNDTESCCGVVHIVRRKVYKSKRKPTIVANRLFWTMSGRDSSVSFRYARGAQDAYICAFYCTSTSNTEAVLLTKDQKHDNKQLIQVAGDLRNSELHSTEQSENVGATSKNLTDHIFMEICKVDNLMVAYEQIKSNPGMMTKGTSGITLNNINKKWFVETSERLLQHRYDFGIRKSIEIPKPGSSQNRPLTITNPRNKIIERSILNQIEPLLEGL